MDLKVWTVGQLKKWLATAENDTDIVVANIDGKMASDYNLGMVNVEEFMSMLTDPTLDGE